MGFESEFSDLMKDVVIIRPYLGQDSYGRPSFGDPITYRARVTGRMRRLVNAQGEDTQSTTTTVLLNSTGIDDRSQITLPVGFQPQQPPILAILRDKDDLGRVTETVYT